MSNGDGEIHEISKEIGQLVAGLTALKGEVSGMRKEWQRHNQAMETKVNGLLDLKHKGAGLLLGVSMIAGTIGAGITVVLQYLRGH